MASSSPESAAVQDDEAEVAYRYELYWRAVIEKDLDAQQELAELRQREDEAIADLDQQRYEAQQAYDAARASDALRHRSDVPSTVLRPVGRARRPSCNARTRGSRRSASSTRSRSSSSDDPPGEADQLDVGTPP